MGNCTRKHKVVEEEIVEKSEDTIVNIEDMKIKSKDFIKEKNGQFKDYYKIGTC